MTESGKANKSNTLQKPYFPHIKQVQTQDKRQKILNQIAGLILSTPKGSVRVGVASKNIPTIRKTLLVHGYIVDVEEGAIVVSGWRK